MKYSEITKRHNQFKMDWLGEGYAETQELGWQCVGGAKIYSKEVYNITLGSFGGTAYNGRLNKNNTFDMKLFNKVLYNGTNKPPVGSIVFFQPDASNGQAGHVGICDLRIKKGIAILEQNGGGKGNYATGDEFNIRVRGLQKCLGRYLPVLDNNID